MAPHPPVSPKGRRGFVACWQSGPSWSWRISYRWRRCWMTWRGWNRQVLGLGWRCLLWSKHLLNSKISYPSPFSVGLNLNNTKGRLEKLYSRIQMKFNSDRFVIWRPYRLGTPFYTWRRMDLLRKMPSLFDLRVPLKNSFPYNRRRSKLFGGRGRVGDQI